MSVDERVRYLLRVATRAEGEGDHWVARIFRRMAEEARPLDRDAMSGVVTLPTGSPAD